MVDAPEKIWAKNTTERFFASDIRINSWPEYVRADIAEREKEELRKERDRCHARLEIDHCFKLGDDDNLIRHEIPLNERSSFPDGITARDETIKLVERRAETAERQLAERDADLARVKKSLTECANYIASPLRLSDDNAEAARRDAIVGRACASLAGSGDGWREMSSAPETGFFLAWTPDFPDMVSCWKAEIFHQARKPGTPRHLSANHFTLWRPLDLPASPSTAGER